MEVRTPLVQEIRLAKNNCTCTQYKNALETQQSIFEAVHLCKTYCCGFIQLAESKSECRFLKMLLSRIYIHLYIHSVCVHTNANVHS